MTLQYHHMKFLTLYNELKLSNPTLAKGMLETVFHIHPQQVVTNLGFTILNEVDSNTRRRILKSISFQNWLDMPPECMETHILDILPVILSSHRISDILSTHSFLRTLNIENRADLRKIVLRSICTGKFYLINYFNIRWDTSVGKQLEKKIITSKRPLKHTTLASMPNVDFPESVQLALVKRSCYALERLAKPSNDATLLHKMLWLL